MSRQGLFAVLLSLLACGDVTAEREEEARSQERLACVDLVDGAASALPIAGVAWREQLVAYAELEVKHPAWGLSHSKRNFLMAMQIAKAENLEVDADVLFAAAFLHDLGGLANHEVAGVDHAVRSAELAPEILTAHGFPSEKIQRVQEVILAHVYYKPLPPNASAEAKAFRDADILDFLGAVGFARIATLTGHEVPTLLDAARMSKQLVAQLPSKLTFASSKCDGAKRAASLQQFQQTLAKETFGDAHY